MAVTEPIARRQLFSCRWIVSARFDLFFFIGSCVFTFLFYGLYHLFVRLGFAVDGTSVLGTYFVFTAFFDHPHIFIMWMG